MRPFEISSVSLKLNDQYLSAAGLQKEAGRLTEQDIFGILHQWMTEGIPYAFRDNPLLYEVARRWITAKLQLHPKEVTVIGSGRLGYAFSKPPKFGRRFSENSDLDLTAISENLFNRSCEWFNRWEADYRQGKVAPRNGKQQGRWDARARSVTQQMKKGFIDIKNIPTTYQDVSQSLYILKEKLRATPSCPTVREVSLRVYRDWAALSRQARINFLSTISAF
jgi:hypothetical protein